jgi:aryl-alcohol dehydrogenase-like predicted oxidoreductase
LRNLNVDCIDLYYVHNPETQLGHVARDEFNRRLRAAFEALEAAVAAGKIRMYGTATWNGYRNETGAQDHLSLVEIVALAEEVGGKDHHFKAIQLPFNMAMPEAVTVQNQEVNGHTVTLLEAAAQLGVTVICSAAILQGQLAGNLPDILARVFGGLATDAQRAIQFVRSTPGVGVALIGMKQGFHVEENLKVAELAPVTQDQYVELFQDS